MPHSHIRLRGMHSNNCPFSGAHSRSADERRCYEPAHITPTNPQCHMRGTRLFVVESAAPTSAIHRTVPGAAGHSSPEHVYSDVQHIYSLTVSGAGILQSHEELCYGLGSSCNVDAILAVKKKYFLFPKVPIPARSRPRLQPMGVGCCFLHRREGDRPLTSI